LPGVFFAEAMFIPVAYNQLSADLLLINFASTKADNGIIYKKYGM